MILIDAHCHLEPHDYPNPEEVIARGRAQGLVHAVVIGQLQRDGDFGAAVELARRFPDFFTATLGIHPHEASRATPEKRAELERVCASDAVVAVGEAGLDFFYNHSPRAEQEEVFRWQCVLARNLKKPLVVHVRDAHRECLDILRQEKVDRGVIHCFSGDTEAARGYLELGFQLSISGMVTYKKSEALQEAVRFAPLERLMVETDSPYLAPIPHRGKKNEPALVVETARKVAELKGVAPDAAALQMARNSRALFGLRVELPEG